jgi:predicted metal-dependent HD superfamily phosphohydrolase
MKKSIKQYWEELASGRPGQEEEFAAVMARYDEPHRFYHNREHLAELFVLYEGCKDKIADTKAVIGAIFYHDLVYDPQSRTNEADSAAIAEKNLTALGFDKAFAQRVAALVNYTRKHDCPAGETDAQLFLDMDMAILGSDPARYVRYSVEVGGEYTPFMGREGFYNGRLNSFLLPTMAKPRLFHTDFFEERFGAQAKKNMTWEISVARAMLNPPAPRP